jgi:3',5'-nucleoside bisphosphate phosphatase
MVKKSPQPDLVDLHVHSNASDGVLAPREVVRQAAEVGLKAIALTDHDTVGGLPEALAAGKEFGVEVIPGVEISADFDAGACHVLGYFVDPSNQALADVLLHAREGRNVRNVEILQKLADLGFPLTMEEVVGGSTDGTVTRAHFASAMIARRYVKSFDDAFDKYLGAGKPAYVSSVHITPAQAIEAIRGAGGLASLAHPRQLKRGSSETEEWVERLAAAGLEAIETATPDHTATYARRYSALARRLGLLETGGTDWHGREDAGIHLGLGAGSMMIHYDLVQKIKDRLAARGSR